MKLTGNELARFADAVAARLGLRVDAERAGELIERHAAIHHEPVGAYLDRLDGDPAEIAGLASELTVGETYFFRHIEQFRAFADIVVPDRLGHGRLHVLSAGCSSGEEPYTLAMLLGDLVRDPRVAICAVDLNPSAIARARAARYSRWSLRATTAAVEQLWFRPDGRDVTLIPELRAAVSFQQSNILDGDMLSVPGRWDAVFCRNVVMYFTDDQAHAMIARLTRAIAPGGYLFLGHAETLGGRTDDFSLCHTHGAFYYRRHPVARTIDLGRHAEVAYSPPAAIALDGKWYEDIRAATQRVHAMVDGALDAGAAPPRPADSPAAPPDLDAIRELLVQEQFGEALGHLDRLRAASPGDRDVAMLRALVLTHAGRFAEARIACGEVLVADATSSGANYLLALCCESAGDTDGAAQMAKRAAELDPSFAMPRVHLGLLARRIGDREIASRELTQAIALLEREAPARLALYGGGFSRQTLLGMCRAELAAIGGAR